MKFKQLATFFLLTFSPLVSMALGHLENVRIERIYAYDDYPAAAAFLQLSEALPECSKGAYINPNAVYFESLYSTILSAFMAGKTVTLQLHTDKIVSNRCEIDAVIVRA